MEVLYLAMVSAPVVTFGMLAVLRKVRGEDTVIQTSMWSSSDRNLNRVLTEFGEYESNPDSAEVSRPLLGDVMAPSSARFYAALGEATALRSDTCPDDPEKVGRFVNAVIDLRYAWISTASPELVQRA